MPCPSPALLRVRLLPRQRPGRGAKHRLGLPKTEPPLGHFGFPGEVSPTECPEFNPWPTRALCRCRRRRRNNTLQHKMAPKRRRPHAGAFSEAGICKAQGAGKAGKRAIMRLKIQIQVETEQSASAHANHRRFLHNAHIFIGEYLPRGKKRGTNILRYRKEIDMAQHSQF